MRPEQEQDFIVVDEKRMGYDEVLALPFEDKIAEVDAQLRSISSWAERVALQCEELRQTFLESSRRVQKASVAPLRKSK